MKFLRSVVVCFIGAFGSSPTLAASSITPRDARRCSALGGAKDIVFYCRSANRARKAADHFASIGFRTFNAGAFQAWKDAEIPVK
jgi:rhodanese-related sulfurtransferase